MNTVFDTPTMKEVFSMRRKFSAAVCVFALLVSPAFAASTPLDDTIADLSHRWAKASYQMAGAEQAEALRALGTAAETASRSFPDKAEPLIWQSIALASVAKIEGGLGGLAKVKHARELLLAAEKINSSALDGSIYCTLGSLYAKVPGWPIGYGDKTKARQYLGKALALDPMGIDANYFYGDLLADQGEYAKASEYLKRALAAPGRVGREDSDAGRRQEVRQLMDDLRMKHAAEMAGAGVAQ